MKMKFVLFISRGMLYELYTFDVEEKLYNWVRGGSDVHGKLCGHTMMKMQEQYTTAIG